MSLKKRLTAVVITALAAVLTFGIAKSGIQISEKQEEEVADNGKDTLYLWYTDEALTSYLSSAAVTYNETHDVRIVPVLETGLEYLENINKASVENNVPDIYISPTGCAGILRRKEERQLNINKRLEEVLKECASTESPEEIEKKSLVQQRGKLGRKKTEE